MPKKTDAEVEAALKDQAEGEVAEKAELAAQEAAAKVEAEKAAKEKPAPKKELTDDEIRAGNFLVRHNHDTKSIEYLDQRGDIMAVRQKHV